MKQILLTQGKIALVDDDDFEMLSKNKWYYDGRYAIRKSSRLSESYRTIWMHRVVLSTPSGSITDHIDGNKLNNQKHNLRICTHSENKCNVGKYVTNKSGFKGVSFHKASNKFIAQIQLGGKPIYLGTFDSAEIAALAYNIAARKVHGRFAKLNSM